MNATAWIGTGLLIIALLWLVLNRSASKPRTINKHELQRAIEQTEAHIAKIDRVIAELEAQDDTDR